MANWKGTPVPNSGLVEKVYFNTNLSNDEVISLLSGLTYSEDADNAYSILETTDESCRLVIMAGGLMIVDIARITDMENGDMTPLLWVSPNADSEMINAYGFSGWNPNVNGIVEVNAEVLSTATNGSYEIGLENDKLSSLFSITPFTQSEDKNILMHPKNEDGTANKDVNLYPRTKVGNLLANNGSKFTMPNVAYKQGGGTAVPNSGICPNVYLNLDLSVNEVKEILNTIDYIEIESELIYWFLFGNYNLGSVSNMAQIIITKINNDYGIILYLGNEEDGAQSFIFSSNSEIFGFEGWGEEFDEGSIFFSALEVSLNNEVAELGVPVGDQNNKLSNLFSITPFTSGGLFETNEDGTPNTDKPIQTGISEERVNELIDLKITGWLGGES